MEYEIVELKQNRVFKGKVIYNINFLDEQIEANKRNIRRNRQILKFFKYFNII